MREQYLLLIGLLTLTFVSLIALVRLIHVVKIFRKQRQRADYSALSITQEDANASRILVPSLLFHTLVFLCLITEVPVYACRYVEILTNTSEVGHRLFVVHLCSYLLLFSAFCVIVTLWSDVAVFEPNRWTVLVSRSMVVLCVCYLLVTVLAVCVCLGIGGAQHFFSSVAFLVFCGYSIAALLLLGTCFLVLGCMLQRRICRVLVTGSCTARLTARVVRLNVVMLACFICFTLRALMLAALVEEQAEGEIDRDPSKGWDKWKWDMRLEWAPHVIPCIAMLYLMRKAGDPPNGASDEDGEDKEFVRDGAEGGEGVQNDYGSNSYAHSDHP